MQTPEAKSKASLGVKTNALIRFAGELPNADTTKFVAQVEVDEKKITSARKYFSKKSLVHFKTFLVLTENFGTKKMNKILGMGGSALAFGYAASRFLCHKKVAETAKLPEEIDKHWLIKQQQKLVPNIIQY